VRDKVKLRRRKLRNDVKKVARLSNTRNHDSRLILAAERIPERDFEEHSLLQILEEISWA
jgi:hypothetical protein